jgi:two-component system response regulator YesN
MPTAPELLALRARDIVEKEYLKWKSVKDLARRMGLTNNYLSAIYRWYNDETITETVNRKKMELAKDLLRKTKLKVYQVARAVKMEQYYFHRKFRKVTGYTSSNYRNLFKEEKNEG